MVQEVESLLDIDLRRIVKGLEARYGVKLPSKVVAADLGGDVGDLFLRFSHEAVAESEPTPDGKVVMHYSKDGSLVAVEVSSISDFGA